MKLNAFEEDQKNNPKFNQRKLKRYWKSMKQFYESSKYKTMSEKSVDEKRKTTIIKFPTQLMSIQNEDKEGLYNGIRNINHK